MQTIFFWEQSSLIAALERRNVELHLIRIFFPLGIWRANIHAVIN